MFDGILQHFGLDSIVSVVSQASTPAGESRISRREFNGDRKHPTLDKNEAFDWIPSYLKATKSMQLRCRAVVERWVMSKVPQSIIEDFVFEIVMVNFPSYSDADDEGRYEVRVNQFGYSLVNLSSVTTTPFIRQFMIRP